MSGGADPQPNADDADARQAPAAEGEPAPDTNGPSPLEPALRQLRALYLYALHYLAVRSDAVVLRLLQRVLQIVFALAAALAGAVAVVTSVVLLLCGIAHGLGALLGGRAWAGELLTGGAVLVAVFLAGHLIIKAALRRFAIGTVEKHERQRENLQREFSANGDQRADGPADRGP